MFSLLFVVGLFGFIRSVRVKKKRESQAYHHYYGNRARRCCATRLKSENNANESKSTQKAHAPRSAICATDQAYCCISV
uniref:Putative secreted protein n=1 Tax=Anopheles darlingi TaxID=43151 RepID=A0A2M4D0G8_ANODA